MLDRIGAAPISWGICEAPGWGRQLPVDRVLAEMRSVGIRATELGAAGWLPTQAAEIRAKLDQFDLQLLGGFVPLVLHDPNRFEESVRSVIANATTMSAAGGTNFVTAVVSDPHDWQRLPLDDADWQTLNSNLDEIDRIVTDFGMTQVVHPHVDTLIETVDEVRRYLNGTSVQLCLDTGHLFIGGANPAQIATEYADRIGLVHLKDVSAAIARRLTAGEFTLMSATQAGLFPSVGSGDVPIAQTIRTVESNGFHGWYVIEQDVAITGGDDPPFGEGPVIGVSDSLYYLKGLAAAAA